MLLEQVDRSSTSRLAEHAEQQVLGADELVLHRLRFGLRGVQHDAHPRRHARFGATIGLRLSRQICREACAATVAGSALSFRSTDGTTPSGCSTQRDEQMLGLDLRVIQLGGELRRREDRLLRLFGEFVQIHGSIRRSSIVRVLPTFPCPPAPPQVRALLAPTAALTVLHAHPPWHTDRRGRRVCRPRASRARATETPDRFASSAES